MSAGIHPWTGVAVPVRSSEPANLYWSTDISAAEIIEAYAPHLRSNQINSLCGDAAVGIDCAECGARLLVGSRSAAKALLSDKAKCEARGHNSGRLCRHCRDAETEAYFRRQREQRSQEIERMEELSSMAYREYLATPEWQERRERAKKQAGFKCQACSAGGQLHVHHRTYVRRGRERQSDLTVFCADCHRLFHDNRKLAENGRAA